MAPRPIAEDQEVVAALARGVAAVDVAYAHAREAVVRQRDAAVPTLRRRVGAGAPAEALLAAAWLAWIRAPRAGLAVLAHLVAEEEAARRARPPQPPDPRRAAALIARAAGPDAEPLLGEFLWKTGGTWEVWRRAACWEALRRRGGLAALERLAAACGEVDAAALAARLGVAAGG